MTKKEQSYLRSVKERAAMNLPCYDNPRPAAYPKNYGYKAVWFQNSYGKRVTLGWTNGMLHNSNCAVLPNGHSFNTIASQTGGNGYETKLDALKAMRWELTMRVARELADIDEMIDQEMGA